MNFPAKYLFATAVATVAISAAAQRAGPGAIIRAEPISGARIEPTLFGNFMELLDDVVPGSWAELLNDRSFAGVVQTADWVYYDGSHDICDREWDANSTWTFDVENPFNGKRCARITAGAEPGSLTQSGLSARKGMEYNFSTYLRSDSGVKVTAILKAALPTGEWLTLASAEISPATRDWEKRSVKMTSIGTTDRAVFELRAEGQGKVWVNKLSLMPGDNKNGWRADVVEAIKEIRPSILRWGGSTIDPGHYLWKNGIGDRDQRTPWRNENWGRIDPNDVGIDEFCQFCELIEAAPLICVSFADGPQSAHDLVEYCNGAANTEWGGKRAANGHPAPYHVQYWEVGNEINSNDAGYLDQFPAFIKAIRSAEADAKILTCDPSQKLLDRVGRDVDFVCPHHYTTDLAECQLDFDRIFKMIDQTPGCSHIKVGVTEWNIDAGAWGLGRARQSTLFAALENARYLNLMMRRSDKIKIANRSNLANSYCGATILTAASGTGVLRQPSHYVMKLYSLHAKPVPLRIQQYDGRIDLFACGSDDKKSFVIFAVNPTRDELEFAPGFAGFDTTPRIVGATTVSDVLHRRQPDVENHWNEPERVKIVDLPTTGRAIMLPAFSATAIECMAN
ncbi:MAG TPA: alpha-L-arabinofuranosidase C-terminal domain-containing protein [Verrucomicrobiae bacterium]|nr:alpha-L-arabinofuranosidase C-terminal domain-containing protein [Verrucomicrobiae bacterium]